MKINYSISNKKYFHYYNLALGILKRKRKFKKKSKNRILSYTQMVVRNYLIFLVIIPFIVFFSIFVHLEFLANILVILMLFILFVNTLSLFIEVGRFIKIQKNKEGQISVNLEGVHLTKVNEEVLIRKWQDIFLIFVLEDVLFVFAKRKVIFFIPLSMEEQKRFIEFFKEMQVKYSSIKLVDTVHEQYPNESFFKKHFLNWGVYIFSFFLSCVFVIGFEIYNMNVIEREMQTIYYFEDEIDTTIYTFGKYGIVEKELKYFYKDLMEVENHYQKNSVSEFMQFLTIDYLKEHRESLKDLIRDFPAREKKAEQEIEKIIYILDEKNIRQIILKWELDEFYNELFYEYTLEILGEITIQEWRFESYQNHLKMQYLTRMLEILTLPDACWSIEKEHLYFCDDAQLQEYNELYDLLMENAKPNDGVKV